MLKFISSVYLIGCMLLLLDTCLSADHLQTGGLVTNPFVYYGDQQVGHPNESKFDVANANLQVHLKTGTTIVGICCRDGIVLGADTRSTGGPLVMDKNKLKIHTISNRIRCCAAGTSADCDQITRKASHHLGLVRIEKELSGESDCTDSVQTAVTSISNTIQSSSAGGGPRKVQSVMILGGVDDDGSALFQIDAEGVPQRIGFGALGSGSTDALAILESARRQWTRNATSTTSTTSTTSSTSSTSSISNKHGTGNANYSGADKYREAVNVAEATAVVRRAVQTGILNDLGSGSHVDLCVITADEVRQWRESLVSSWDADRLPSHKNLYSGGAPQENSQLVGGESSSGGAIGSARVKRSTAEHVDLGRRVFSRLRPIKRFVAGTVEESMGTGSVDESLAFNVEQL